MPASITLARAATLTLVAASGVASAAQFNYSLFATVEHSDNITLSTDHPISQNVLTPGINFTYVEQGSVFQANAAGTLGYQYFPGNKFDNQVQTQLTGQANWSVLPQRLDFTVEDYAGVQPIDSLASNSPDNRQQTNVLSLGPTLHLRFGEAMRGQVELRYLNSYASKVDDFNSSRGMGAFRLFRDISPTTQLSANIEIQRVTFSNQAGGPDYDRTQVFAHYVKDLAHFYTDVTLGWARLKFDHGMTDSRPMARLTLGWQPSYRNGLSLTGAYEFADAAQDMMMRPGQNIIDAVDTNPVDIIDGTGTALNAGTMVIDSQVYRTQSLSLNYTFHSERLSLNVTPVYHKLDYLNDPTFNQTGRGGNVGVDYRLRPNLTLSGFLTAERLNYDSFARTDKSYRYGLDLRQQWSRHWSWHVAYIRQLRSSNAIAQSYHENEIFFGVVFLR
jgi:hypothetical protein